MQGKILLFVVTETCGIGKRKRQQDSGKRILVKTGETDSGKLDYNV
jgi:hypothetical protein